MEAGVGGAGWGLDGVEAVGDVGSGLRRGRGDDGGRGGGRNEATGLQLIIIMQIHVVHTVGTSSP